MFVNKRRKKMRFWVDSLLTTKKQLDIIHTSSEEAEESFQRADVLFCVWCKTVTLSCLCITFLCTLHLLQHAVVWLVQSVHLDPKNLAWFEKMFVANLSKDPSVQRCMLLLYIYMYVCTGWILFKCYILMKYIPKPENKSTRRDKHMLKIYMTSPKKDSTPKTNRYWSSKNKLVIFIDVSSKVGLFYLFVWAFPNCVMRIMPITKTEPLTFLKKVCIILTLTL